MSKVLLRLIIALSIPILFALVLFATITIPRIQNPPQGKFIYLSNYEVNYDSTQNRTPEEFRYYIDKNTIIKADTSETSDNENNKLNLINNSSLITYRFIYVYDMKGRLSTEITYEEAKEYQVETGLTSPNGFTITQLDNSNSSENYIVKKGLATYPLYFDTYSISIYGWIK